MKDDPNPHFCKGCALKCRRIINRQEIQSKKDSEQQTALILHSPLAMQPKQQAQRGRPVKYSPFDRLKLAISAAKGTSISQVGVNYAIFKASSIEDLRNLEAPSRTLVTQALAELNQCFKRELAKKFSSSTSLNLGIDATTDSLAISFG